MSKRQVALVRAKLCGITGCTCADNGLGTRGMREIIVMLYQDGSASILPSQDA